MPIFDYTCQGLDCGTKEERLVLLSNLDEQQFCLKCKRVMVKEFPAPVGRVKGTDNPVKV